MMIKLLLILFLFAGCISNSSQKAIGNYAGQKPFVGTKIELQGNNRFVYQHFADVGGWQEQIEGHWRSREDTILLNSDWLPTVDSVSERFNRLYPNKILISFFGIKEEKKNAFVGYYDVHINSARITMGEFDSSLVNGKIEVISRYYINSDSLENEPLDIQIDMNGYHYNYLIENPRNNEFVFYFNCFEEDVITKNFLHDEKWILKQDTLFSIFKGNLNRNYFLVKSN